MDVDVGRLNELRRIGELGGTAIRNSHELLWLLDLIATLRAEVSRLREAVAELCLLQYGTEPANLDAIVAKYAKMRQDRIEMDAALAPPEEPAHE